MPHWRPSPPRWLLFVLVRLLAQPCLAAGANGTWSRQFPPWGEPDAPTAGAPPLSIPIIAPLTNHGCGASRYMSIRLATSHLNRRDATYCPAIATLRNSFEVRYDVEDSAANGIGAVQGVIALQGREPVRVVLGPNGSGESQATSTYLSVFGVPQVSWAATAASLSGKAVYPNFWRTISPDSFTMRVLVKFLLWLGYTQCNVIYFDDVYTDGQRGDLAGAGAELGLAQNPLKVPNSGEGGAAVSPASREVMMRVLGVVRSSACRVNVGLAINTQAWDLFQAIQDMGMLSERGFAWFGGDGLSGAQLAGLPERVRAFNGSLYLLANSRGPRVADFAARWAQDMPGTLTPEFNELAWCKNGTGKGVCNQLPAFTSWVVGKNDVQFVCNTYEALAYDAMVTLALVADRLMTKKGVPPAALTEKDWLAEMLLLAQPANAFTCLSGLLSFNQNQEREMPISIFNWHADRGLVAPEVATWTGVTGFRWKIGQTVYWPGGDSGYTMSEANITFIPSGHPPKCPGGFAYDTLSWVCAPCPAGQYLPAVAGSAVATSCLLCPGGTYSHQAGQTDCEQCKKGSISNADRLACRPCDPGHIAASDGLSECVACDAGSFAGASGSTQCTFCPRGSYAAAKGTATCTMCPEGLTTENIASRTSAMCACAEGTYLPDSAVAASSSEGAVVPDNATSDRLPASICMPCPTGMACPGGSDMRNYRAKMQAGSPDSHAAPFPMLLPQFWSDPSEPLSVYRCDSASLCPGGDPGTCANPDTTGLCCASCAPRFRRTSKGCRPCQSSDVLPMVAVLVAGPLLAALLAGVAMADTDSSRVSLITVALTTGQLVCTVQMMGVFRGFKITWVQPLTALMDSAGLLAFKLEIMKPECFMGKDSPILVFLIRLACLPVLASLLALIMMLVSLWKGRCSLHRDRFHNALGLLFVMLYVPITVAMIDPLQCAIHPNGKSSMSSNLAVRCWATQEHVALVAMSIVGFLCYPVAMLTRVAFVTLRYPAIVASGGGLRLLMRFRFLFARFRPECYFWGFWYLLRNLLLPLVPVAFPSSSLWQIVLSGLILQINICFQVAWFPWRTQLANYSEVMSLGSLMLFIQTASFMANSDTNATMVSTLLCAILISALGIAVGLVAYAIFRVVRPIKKYTIFLSHHKEGAASLARWFKIQILANCSMSVFLDSDELDNLDLIVDVVRCRTRHVVLLLTRMTLTRLWCAAEIAAAVTYKVHMVPVHCCEYTPPDKAFMDSLRGRWTRSQLHAVEQYGITLHRIEQAYEKLIEMPGVTFARFGAPEEQVEVVARVLQLCGVTLRIRSLTQRMANSSSGAGTTSGSMARSNSFTRSSGKRSLAQILIVGASSDAEARTTCEVLRLLLVMRSGMTIAAIHDANEADEHRSSAEHLIVVLTRGALHDPAFEQASLALVAPAKGPPAQVQIVTVLADTNFPFPSPEFYATMEAEGGSRAQFAAYLRRIFNILALPFSPQGSTPIMDVQVAGLCQRFRPRPRAMPPGHTGSVTVTPSTSLDAGVATLGSDAGQVQAYSSVQAPLFSDEPAPDWKPARAGGGDAALPSEPVPDEDDGASDPDDGESEESSGMAMKTSHSI